MGYSELLKDRKFLWLIGGLGLIVPLEIFSLFSIGVPIWVKFPLYLSMLVIFGRGVIGNGLKSLVRFKFSDINLLMTVAIFGALYLGHYEEGVIIVVLFSIGEALEEFGITRSQRAMESLSERVPESAEVKGKENRIPVGQVSVDEVIILRPGDRVPLDGTVISGLSIVDEAVITGEPLPKNKYEGDQVYAGSINSHGYLEVRVEKPSDESVLSRIISLAEESQEKKSRSQRFIEKFATYYTPSMLATALLLVVVPVGLLGMPFDPWFTQALTILLISCPCALVISTPIAVFSSMGNVSRHGVLVKGGRFMEEAGKIKAVAFDKTRTLTRGEPMIADIIPLNGFTRGDVLSCAGGLESLSEHPVGRSIHAEAVKMGLHIHPFENFESIPGLGVKGQCTICYDRHHCVGSLRFVLNEHSVKEEVIEIIEKLEKEGKTTIVVTDEKRVKGVIAVMDEIREESPSVIKELERKGIKTIMLSGDNMAPVNYVASKLSIHEVRWGLLPQDKVREVHSLIARYGHVAMVGDGINDAPALAASSVGIALGAIGSDLAIENGDISLMSDNLRLIPRLIEVGKACSGIIKVNILSAVAMKLSFLVLALVGMGNLALAIFADVGVTVLVILNGLRMFNYRSE
jgi:Cd2+/Zn2+-exporting ATPase